MTSRSSRAAPRRRGFTIMEVMVAVMIFAVAIVSLFGAQFTAISTSRFARYTTAAIELARCKMSELELEIQINNGFEEGDVSSSGSCCELLDGETMVGDFQCRWQVEVVEMPDVTSLLMGGGGDGTDSEGGGGLLGDLGMDLGEGEEGGDEGLGMVASLAPMLGDMLKQAIRRVTVTVEWEQGSTRKEFVLQQFLVHPTQGPDLMMLDAAANAQESAEGLQDLQQQVGEQRQPGGP